MNTHLLRSDCSARTARRHHHLTGRRASQRLAGTGVRPYLHSAAIARIREKPPDSLGFLSERGGYAHDSTHARQSLTPAAVVTGGVGARGPCGPGASRQYRTPAVATPAPKPEQLRLAERLFVRPCVSHQGAAHGRMTGDSTARPTARRSRIRTPPALLTRPPAIAKLQERPSPALEPTRQPDPL